MQALKSTLQALNIDNGEDNFEKVFDDGEEIFEKVFDDGEDIFEEVFDDGEDIFEEVFHLVINAKEDKIVKEVIRSDGL